MSRFSCASLVVMALTQIVMETLIKSNRFSYSAVGTVHYVLIGGTSRFYLRFELNSTAARKMQLTQHSQIQYKIQDNYCYGGSNSMDTYIIL